VKKLIRDILREENDWDWAKEVDDSHGWFEKYKENSREFTPIMNLGNRFYSEFYGHARAEGGFYGELGEYICENHGNVEGGGWNISRLCDSGIGEGKSFLGTLFITSLLNEERLTKIKPPINHNEWGEGWYEEDGHTESRSYSHSSWFLDVDGVMFHIGIDHRGTSVEIREQDISSYDQLVKTSKKLIDLTI
jgi:hypothetical protein